MANIVVKSEEGLRAVIQTPPPAQIVVSGALRGPRGPIGPGVPVGGLKDEVLTKASNTDADTYWVALRNDSNFSKITQEAHELTVGTIVFFNGTAFQRSRANVIANAEVAGMVSQVIDADTFELCTEGYVSGLSDLTVGPLYWLSTTVPGGLTLTKPTAENEVVKPLFTATTPTSGFFHNYIGYEL